MVEKDEADLIFHETSDYMSNDVNILLSKIPSDQNISVYKIFEGDYELLYSGENGQFVDIPKEIGNFPNLFFYINEKSIDEVYSAEEAFNFFFCEPSSSSIQCEECNLN